MRILSIQATWVPPAADWQTDRFVYLSEHLEGDILHPVWFRRPEEVEAEFGPGTYPEYARGRWHYHWFLSFRYNGRLRLLRMLWFFVRKGLELHRRNPYDCIIVYSHMAPALAAALLKMLTGARLIVEIMTAADLSYLHLNPRRTLGDRVMRFVSNLFLHISVLSSDRVHLLYATQLDHYRWLRRVPASVFHDFVPLSRIPAPPAEPGPVVLMVGSPWYLKGADLLIDAFRRVQSEFPEVRLQIQGYNADSGRLEAMVADCPRIEILKAEPNPQVLERISRAMVLVLPSRCEGMGRVLLEAMGAKVPIIGSDAGGIPHYIRHGENGLIFSSGNADELTAGLRELLADPELRRKLGAAGYEKAHASLDERAYVEEFTRMVEATGRNE
jgi:glycosyltransferase involved in cell wall biosynthesis